MGNKKGKKRGQGYEGKGRTCATMSSMRRCWYQMPTLSNASLYFCWYRSSNIWRKRPSYFFRMVFLVDRYRGLHAPAPSPLMPHVSHVTLTFMTSGAPENPHLNLRRFDLT